MVASTRGYQGFCGTGSIYKGKSGGQGTGSIYKGKSGSLEDWWHLQGEIRGSGGLVASTRGNQDIWGNGSIYKGKSRGLVASTRGNQGVWGMVESTSGHQGFWGNGSIYKGISGDLGDWKHLQGEIRGSGELVASTKEIRGSTFVHIIESSYLNDELWQKRWGSRTMSFFFFF